MSSRWHLRIFGIPELQDAEGRPLPFRTRKQLALLVYLALEAQDRAVSRDLLVELLWDDVIPERGRHSLSQGLSVIRQHLGRDAVTRGPAAVRLVCPLPTDLDRVAAKGVLPIELAQPLKELDDCGGSAFTVWLEATRTQCLRAARRLLSEQLDAARRNGNLRLVHERAAELYRVDPYSDTAVHALAEQSLLEGDAAGAIKLLRTHLDHTREELQCNPHPDVERLLKRIETGAIRIAKEKPAPLSHTIPQRPEVFVGREEELSQLEALWAEARAGGLKTCLVTGPAGIGKSTLIRRFATSVASRAWPVWQVSCQEIGINIPFAAVSELIHLLMREPSVSGTDPRWLAEASRVTPSLRSAYPGVPEPPPVAPESVRIRVAEALAQMLDAAADGGPTLLVFDDMQQMDPASWDVLSVLVRRVISCPMLFLSAWRATEQYQRDPTEELQTGFRWEITVEVPPLMTEVAVRMVDTICEDSRTAELPPRTIIAELAMGNPYLIEMLVSDWQRHGEHSLAAAQARGRYNTARWRPPATMRRAFERQYRGLDGNAERVLNLLAVAGRQMAVSEVSSLLSMPPQHADHATLDLIKRGIVRVEGDDLGFKNEFHRAFVYYAMSDESRTYHHARLARTLDLTYDTDDFQRALEVSHHFLNAWMIPQAVDAVSRGADLAVTRGAANEAERALNAVLGVSTGPDAIRLNILLARSLVVQGKYRQAIDTLQRVELNVTSPSDRTAVLALRAEALQRGGLANANSIQAAVNLARADALTYGSASDHMNLLQVTAEAAYESWDWKLLAQVRDDAKKLATSGGDTRTRMLAHLTAGYCALVSGQWKDAITFFKSFMHLTDVTSCDPEQVRVLNGLGIALMAVGRWSDAVAAYRRAISLADRIGDTQETLKVLSNLGVLYDDWGMFADAVDAYQTALELADASAAPRRLADLYTNIAGLSIALGNLAEADRFIKRAAGQAQESGHPRLIALVRLMQAYYHLARSELEAAWSSLAQADTLRRGQVGILDNQQLYWLVKSYYIWTRYGHQRMHRVLMEQARTLHRSHLAHRLSVQLFTEWVDHHEGVDATGHSAAMDIVLRRAVYGAVAGVVAIGVIPRGVPELRHDESPAHLVCRAFPDRKHVTVPNSVTDR